MKHSFRLVVVLFVCFLSTGAVLLRAADQAPNGYWKFVRYEVGPKPEYYPKPMPGRLLEADSKGFVDIAAGSIRNTCIWNVDDINRKAYLMSSSFVVQADHTLAFLIPANKLTLSGTADLTGQCSACGSNYRAGIDNGDAFRIDNVRIGQSASKQGTLTLPNSNPGGGMVIWINSYLASNGAWSGEVRLIYEMVAGTPPSGGSLPGGTGGGTTPPGTGTGPGGSGGGTTPPGPGSPGGSSGGGMALRAETTKVKSGENVTVPIYLDNSSGLANMNFNVVYESKVAVAGSPVKGAMLPPPMLMVPNFGNAGLVRIGLAGPDDIKGSGIIVQIPFKAVGPPGAKTELKLEVTTVRGASGTVPPLRTINGLIEIIGGTSTGGSGGGGTTPGGPGSSGGSGPGSGTKPGTGSGGLPGDANGNGVIEAIDALQALKMSVGLIPENLICDMDKDGKVTSTDARLILSKAVGK